VSGREFLPTVDDFASDYRKQVNAALVKLFNLVHSHKFSHLQLDSDEDVPVFGESGEGTECDN
jgi:hypothetical protein